jgi:hypothetical protein
VCGASHTLWRSPAGAILRRERARHDGSTRTTALVHDVLRCARLSTRTAEGVAPGGLQAHRRYVTAGTPLLVRALALHGVGLAASHFESPLVPGRPGLTRSVSPRMGSVACVRAAASPNEVRLVARGVCHASVSSANRAPVAMLLHRAARPGYRPHPRALASSARFAGSVSGQRGHHRCCVGAASPPR